jgi:HPr kinase/phosphorylase
MSVVNVHASCVILADAGAIFGAPSDGGILILGESGAGKSSVVLKLLALGARLVADDRVELFVRDGVLHATAPATLAGLLEARGLGIVALPYAADSRIMLAVRLGAAPQRYPHREDYEPPAPLIVRAGPPLLRLSADDSAVAEKIVLAAAAFSNALFREAPQ